MSEGKLAASPESTSRGGGGAACAEASRRACVARSPRTGVGDAPPLAMADDTAERVEELEKWIDELHCVRLLAQNGARS